MEMNKMAAMGIENIKGGKIVQHDYYSYFSVFKCACCKIKTDTLSLVIS